MDSRTQYIDEICIAALDELEFLKKKAIEEAKGENSCMLAYWLGQVNAFDKAERLLEYVAILVVNSESPEDRKEFDFR